MLTGSDLGVLDQLISRLEHVMATGKHVWTQQEIDAFNSRTASQKSVEGVTHGDEGTDQTMQAGDPCTDADGRSGYMVSSGDKLVCRAS